MAWQPYVFEADLVSTLVLPRAVLSVQPRSIFFAARILSLILPTSPSGFPYLSLNQTSKFTAPALILRTTTCKSKTKIHHRRSALAITTILARGGPNEAPIPARRRPVPPPSSLPNRGSEVGERLLCPCYCGNTYDALFCTWCLFCFSSGCFLSIFP